MPAPAAKSAFLCLGYISLGLENGTVLHLRPGDYVPPSWVAEGNEYQTREWVIDKNVVLVAEPDPAALEQAEAALEQERLR